jgi:hypothetical protein
VISADEIGGQIPVDAIVDRDAMRAAADGRP